MEATGALDPPDPPDLPTELDGRLLAGLELLDQGDFFAAHEALEEVWAGEVGATRHLLQALIQLTVALHHRSLGNGRGAAALLERAAEHCEQAREGAFGIDGRELGAACRALLAAEISSPGRLPAPPSFASARARLAEARRAAGLSPEPRFTPFAD